MFPDETIQLLDVTLSWGPPIAYNIIPSSKTTITSYSQQTEIWWTSCGILADTIDENNSIRTLAGEASYGSDGFIAVINLNTSKLIWLAFFQSLNPFNQIKLIDAKIYAASTLGCIWQFDIKNPIQPIVSCS